MTLRLLVPRFGSVSLPTGFLMDYQTMRFSERQQTENVTCYGGTLNAIYVGNGTPDQDISITGFPFKGASGSTLGFGSMANTNGDVGATATFCFDNNVGVTGGSGSAACTVTGTYLVDSVSLDTGRLVPAARTTMALKQSQADCTYSWATS